MNSFAQGVSDRPVDLVGRLLKAYEGSGEPIKSVPGFVNFMREALTKYPPHAAQAATGLVYLSLQDGSMIPLVQPLNPLEQGADLQAINFTGTRSLPF